MARMGPKTQAEQLISGALIPGDRPPAPPGLNDAGKRLWNAVVQRLPADWFPVETHGMLELFCRHAVYADQFSREIAGVELQIAALQDEIAGLGQGLVADAEGDEGDAPQKRLTQLFDTRFNLHKLHALESDRVMSIGTKLRLTNQSRFPQQTAYRKATASGPQIAAPWADWGQEVSAQ